MLKLRPKNDSVKRCGENVQLEGKPYVKSWGKKGPGFLREQRRSQLLGIVNFVKEVVTWYWRMELGTHNNIQVMEVLRWELRTLQDPYSSCCYRKMRIFISQEGNKPKRKNRVYKTQTHVHPHFGLRALGLDVIPSIPWSPWGEPGPRSVL